MKTTNKKPKNTPAEYSTVCPYLMVDDVETQMDFLEKVFGATEKEKISDDKGIVMHGEVIVGEIVIMLSKSKAGWPAQTAMNYLFVPKVDEVYKFALEMGAESIMEPGNRDYGFREGGIKDPQGNSWWIASSL